MHFKIYPLLIFPFMLFLSACVKTITEDLSYLPGFIKHNYSELKPILSDTVDLYIDYSTCVAEAKNSTYFKSTHPSIVDCSPIFYSIKGSKITKETDDRQEVYNLLSNIREVNHADIKSAVKMIVNNNHQAVLITDGEYYLQGNVRDNLNNPYLAEEFRIWLNKGLDIYFYCEPYLESNKHYKYRYYILFTDDDIYDNINDRFSRSASAEENNVTSFHLCDGQVRVIKDNDYPIINEAVSPSTRTGIENGIDIQEYYLSWEDMKEYMSEGNIDYTYILRGLYIDNSDVNSYKIEEITPIAYQIYPAYKEYCDSIAINGKLPKARKLKKIEDIFEIDKDIFEETGEIVLKLDDDFDGEGLSDEHPNLLKIDFVVTEAKNNFTRNDDLNYAFKWKSISAAQGHAENTSLYESISQVLQNPKFNPQKREIVLYTIYLSTYNL